MWDFKTRTFWNAHNLSLKNTKTSYAWCLLAALKKKLQSKTDT